MSQTSVDADFIADLDPIERSEPTLDAVKRAWLTLLGPKSLNGNRRWSEAGGDSLSSLQLVWLVETALKRRVGLEVMADDPTPAELAAAIVRRPSDTPPVSDARFVVFLAPGIFGDEPKLVNFRNALAGDMELRVLEYPDIDGPAWAIGDLDAIVTRLQDAVSRQVPDGPLYLAGHSAGGAFVFELARRLRAAGRPPAFVGVIDSVMATSAPQRSSLIHDLKSANAISFRWFVRYAPIRLMIAARLYGPVVLITRAFRKMFGAHRAFAIHQMLAYELRIRALRSISRSPRYPGAVHLFRAEQGAGVACPHDLGWSEFADDVRIIPIEAAHADVFAQPWLVNNAAAFRRAVLTTTGAP